MRVFSEERLEHRGFRPEPGDAWTRLRDFLRTCEPWVEVLCVSSANERAGRGLDFFSICLLRLSKAVLSLVDETGRALGR